MEGVHFSRDKKCKWTLTASPQALLRYYIKFQSTSASYTLFSPFGWSPTDGWCFPPSSVTSSLQIRLQLDSFWKGEKIACVKSSERRLFFFEGCFMLSLGTLWQGVHSLPGMMVFNSPCQGVCSFHLALLLPHPSQPAPVLNSIDLLFHLTLNGLKPASPRLFFM